MPEHSPEDSPPDSTPDSPQDSAHDAADQGADQGDGALYRRLDEVERSLHRIGRDLASLRAALGRELRTGRIVVEEDDGFERVIITARGAFGFVAVRGRGDDGGSTCVELFANDAVDGDGVHVGLALSDRGDVVAAFEVLEGNRSRRWITDVP